MVNFSDKFIAYVDVLGFKRLVSDAERGSGLPLPEILRLVECLGTGAERDRFDKYGPTCCPHAPRIEKNLDFRVIQISDCVVVSAEISPAAIINVVSHCFGAIIQLLYRGIMCRGYIKRGLIYHTDSQVMGSGYQEAVLAEREVSAFRREADERGTPYVEVDTAVADYVESQSDTCVREMFSRMVKRDGDTVVLFPFKSIVHSFIVAGFGKKFHPEKERRSNQNFRTTIHMVKERVWSFVDQSNASAVAKAKHYISALDEQLAVCDRTDEFISMLEVPSGNSQPDALLSFDKTLSRISGLPEELPGDPRRQAVSSIHGTVYQAWWSIDAWLRLADADEVIYLEGAEDFDIVKNDAAITVQVKRHTGTISLGTDKALAALENFWKLSQQEEHRSIYFHYLTTSSIAMEQGANFGGIKGIEAWRAAHTNPVLALEIRKYLLSKLDGRSPLRESLTSSSVEDLQERLFRRFHWLTDQPDLDAVKESVNNRIRILLSDQGRSLSLTEKVRKYLESRFWEIILKESSAKRCLTRGDLLHQVEAAITSYIPVQVDRLPDLLGKAHPGQGLLNLLLEKSPRPPEPLLLRPALTKRLEELVRNRKPVLLTGSVCKGKTTIAQLVCSSLCLEAWWINVTGRQPDQVDNAFLALANRIEGRECPALVVIDDLDIGPAAYRVYRDSLALVLHRGSTAGRGIILTARGEASASAVAQDFVNVEFLEIPELSSDDIEILCFEHGCPRELSSAWAVLISMWTLGHPKLVQVRLAELASSSWPSPVITDFNTQPSVVGSVRQKARQLFSESTSGPIAEFVYLVSECSVLMHRSVAIRLAETIPGINNGGDVLDNLTGKWIERLEGEWYQATTLLKGVAADVWSPEKRRSAHILLHDAILAKHTLAPFEAAALIFHAYSGGDPRRLALSALRLQQIDDEHAKREVERQLLWLPFVALEKGQFITDDAIAGAILRELQFRVARTLDLDCLPQICSRWVEDVERIQHPEPRSASHAVMWFSMGFAQTLKVPLKLRLDAIIGIRELPRNIIETYTDVGPEFFEAGGTLDGLPKRGSTAQALFLCACRTVRDLAGLEELMQWLDKEATEDIRQEFDAMLEWPFVQSLGAFVQGAWASVHEEIQDWEPWLALLKSVEDCAKRRASPRFGREAAKAKAIILGEYLERVEDALAVLDQAEEVFGPSTILMEQRANTLFQARDDESVLKIWGQLTSDPVAQHTLDPFSHRRAGISAARLKHWDKAGEIFSAAADSIKPGTLQLTRFGLQLDAALAVSLGGNQASAAKLLANAVLSLPPESSAEGDSRWEAVLRAAVEVCRTIENRLWKPTEAEPKFQPGHASSPDLQTPKIQAGQAGRNEMTRVQVLHLLSTLTSDPSGLSEALEVLEVSRYFAVRWTASEAQLALAYSAGAGSGFVEALLAFDKATADLLVSMQQRQPLLVPDEGPSRMLK